MLSRHARSVSVPGVRGASGQSSLEYLGIVLLASLVIGVGAALVDPAGVAHAVVAQVARGICIARGGDCQRDRAPCILASRSRSTDKRVRIAFVTLGGGRTLVRERRSDGTQVITDVQRLAGGGETAIGGEISIGGHGIGLLATATIEGRVGYGRSWFVPSAAAADRLIAQLDTPPPAVRARLHDNGPALTAPPAPDVTYTDKGLGSAIEARLGTLGLRYDTEDLMGVRHDARSGERMFTVRRRNDAVATLSLFAGQGIQASGRVEQRYAVTVDRDGRPLDLAVIEQRRLAAGVKPPGRAGSLLAAAGGPVLPDQQGAVATTERHLDLTDPDNLAAGAAFLRAVQHPHLQVGDAVAVSAELDRRLDAAGSAQVRLYALDVRRRGVQGRVAFGVVLGGAAPASPEPLALVRAAGRAPLGSWETREDCVAVA